MEQHPLHPRYYVPLQPSNPPFAPSLNTNPWAWQWEKWFCAESLSHCTCFVAVFFFFFYFKEIQTGDGFPRPASLRRLCPKPAGAHSVIAPCLDFPPCRSNLRGQGRSLLACPCCNNSSSLGQKPIYEAARAGILRHEQ